MLTSARHILKLAAALQMPAQHVAIGEAREESFRREHQRKSRLSPFRGAQAGAFRFARMAAQSVQINKIRERQTKIGYLCQLYTRGDIGIAGYAEFSNCRNESYRNENKEFDGNPFR
jgi:hypothetical protein